MAGHKKAVAVVVVIACMFTCSARPLQLSIRSPIGKNHNEEGRVHIAVRPDDVAKIKETQKLIDNEMGDVTKSSSKLKYNNRLNVVHSERSAIENPVFHMLPKGPVAPGGPSPIHNGPPFSLQTGTKHNEEGRVHTALHSDDVVEIKGIQKGINLEMDDFTKSFTIDENPTSTDRDSHRLKRTTFDDAEKLVFARLPKGPVPPSGPSTAPPCYDPEGCHD